MRGRYLRQFIAIALTFNSLIISSVYADCPTVSELKAPAAGDPKMIWSAPGGWRSQLSLLKDVDHFKGAQWIGTNVGRVICVYESADQDEFPLTLQNGHYMEKPSGDNWHLRQHAESDSEVNTTVMNCTSNDPASCPFSEQEVNSDPSKVPDKPTDQNTQTQQDESETNENITKDATTSIYDRRTGAAQKYQQDKKDKLDDFLRTMEQKQEQGKTKSDLDKLDNLERP